MFRCSTEAPIEQVILNEGKRSGTQSKNPVVLPQQFNGIPRLRCAPLGMTTFRYVSGIFFRRDGAPGRLGRVNRSTPFLNSAFAFDSSTSAGNSMARSNEP